VRKIVQILLVLVAMLTGLGYVLRAGDGTPTRAGTPTTAVTRGPLRITAIALGTVELEVGAEVKVGSRLSGVVATLHARIGDEVLEGDLLATLDDRQLRARLDALRAELAETLARLEYAQLQRHSLEAVDETAEMERANARMQVAALESAADRLRARQAEAEIELAYTRIRAPVSGTVASVSTYEGETVAASFAAPTFVTIVDLSRLEVRAYVDETDIGRIHAGQPATFRVDAYPEREIQGAVAAIYPKAELVNNVVNYVAVVKIEDGHSLVLRPEMTAHVSFELDRRDDVLSIPRSALIRRGTTSSVVTRTASGWEPVSVETGLFTTQRIEITHGLTAGDEVVVNGQLWWDQQQKGS
jgi:HlyD family secretion protein